MIQPPSYNMNYFSECSNLHKQSHIHFNNLVSEITTLVFIVCTTWSRNRKLMKFFGILSEVPLSIFQVFFTVLITYFLRAFFFNLELDMSTVINIMILVLLNTPMFPVHKKKYNIILQLLSK